MPPTPGASNKKPKIHKATYKADKWMPMDIEVSIVNGSATLKAINKSKIQTLVAPYDCQHTVFEIDTHKDESGDTVMNLTVIYETLDCMASKKFNMNITKMSIEQSISEYEIADRFVEYVCSIPSETYETVTKHTTSMSAAMHSLYANQNNSYIDPYDNEENEIEDVNSQAEIDVVEIELDDIKKESDTYGGIEI